MTAACLRSMLTGDDEGATAVEYGLLISLIAAVIVVGVAVFGSRLDDVFDRLKGKF